MSAVDLAVARLKTEEGYRALPYLDAVGKLTVGYGFQVGAGLSRAAAAALLSAQVQETYSSLNEYSWFQGLDDIRSSVFLDLAFNLGLPGLLHFPKTLIATGDKSWQVAHDELLNSKAAKQDPKRYAALAQIFLTGVA
jgi:lysozyme